MNENSALSVIPQATPEDEFPVLKAFQQYIDAEQAKARRRMLSLSIFFGCMLTIVVVVFVVLLIGASQRNQLLNDRLIEFAMTGRDRPQSAVVVQQPAQDNSAIIALTEKLAEIQKSLDEARQEAAEKEKIHSEDLRAVQLAQEKARAQEALEIERLKNQLAAEKEKAAKEREAKREAELEAYRRKHYPEFYAKQEAKETPPPQQPQPVVENEPEDEEPDPIDELLKDLDKKDAITYYEDDDDEEDEDEEEAEEEDEEPEEPVKKPQLKGTKGSWRIPRN